MYQNQFELYTEFWNPSLYVLNDIESRGILFDTDACEMSRKEAEADQRIQLKNIKNWASWYGNSAPDNWDSNSQISSFLYDVLDWPIPPVCGSRNAVKINFDKKKTVDYGAINYHRTHSDSETAREACQHILDYRQARDDGIRLSKLPTYLGADGRLHSVLAPSTDTGRLSSRNPALQQICSADRDKYGIRRAFIPKSGYLFIVADYSQLELYVLAYYLKELFGDLRLLHALQSGDIHSYVAKQAWPDKIGNFQGNLKDHPNPEIQKLRKDVKSVVYGMNYGKSATGLGAAITDENGRAIGRRKAQELIDTVMAITGADRFQEYIIAEAERLGGVFDLFGRWRPLPEINSNERGLKRSAERKALNSPIQMSAASIVTMAMLRCSTMHLRSLRDRGFYSAELDKLQARMVLQVHDELVFEVPRAYASEGAGIVKSIMENAHRMDLVVNSHVAENWYEGK